MISASGLFLLLSVKSSQTTACDLHDLETNAWNVPHCVTAAAKSGDQDFVVLINKVQAAVLRHKCGDLLTFDVIEALHQETCVYKYIEKYT